MVKKMFISSKAITKIQTILIILIIVVAGVAIGYYYVSTLPPSKIKLKVGVMSAHGMSDCAIDAAERFNKMYPNIEVEVTPIGFDVLLDKMLTDFTTHSHTYDCYSVAFEWTGTVGDYLMDFEEIMKKYPDVVDPNYDFDDIPKIIWDTCKWKGKIIGYPMSSGPLNLYYRTDLFENPEYKALFKEKYGYELRMPLKGEKTPLTPKQLHDYAEFFTTGVKWREGEQYGISLAAAVDDPLFWTYLSFFGPYRRSPEGLSKFGPVDPDWGDFFTSDHKPAFDPRISDLGLKALNDYLAMGKFSPNPTALDWVTSNEPFASGITAMFLGWAGYWPSFAGPESPIHGKVAVTLSPSAPIGVWYLAINKDCQYPKEMFMFIQWFTNKDNCKYYYEKFSEPAYRISTWTDPRLLEEMPDLWVQAPLHEIGVLGTKISVFPELRYAMGVILNKAWIGELTPEEALISCADEWNRIIKEAGL
jgi:ABC-type glycerol-3-phosphate transport system substrate-binding protein